jgi:RNA polymerase-binding transcription factor DksA
MATAKKPAAKAARSAAGKATPAKAVSKRAAVKKSPVKAAPPKAVVKKSTSSSTAKAASSTTKKPIATKPIATKAPSTTKEPAHVTSSESTRTDAKKPAAAKKPAFDAKFLDAQRVLLNEERATYLRQADSLQAEADSLAELREPGDVQFDEESGEGDTLQVERERDLALSARARHEVEEIDRALEKLELGTYGICEVSGEPIPKARLQAIPQARERVEYKVGGFRR